MSGYGKKTPNPTYANEFRRVRHAHRNRGDYSKYSYTVRAAHPTYLTSILFDIKNTILFSVPLCLCGESAVFSLQQHPASRIKFWLQHLLVLQRHFAEHNHGLGAVGCSQLAEYGRDVRLDGGFSDAEFIANLLV